MYYYFSLYSQEVEDARLAAQCLLSKLQVVS